MSTTHHHLRGGSLLGIKDKVGDKSKRWAGDIEALTIGVDENIY